MSVLNQATLLLAGISGFLGIVAYTFINRGGGRFYPSRAAIYDRTKLGFIVFFFGHLFAVWQALGTEINNLEENTHYLFGGVAVMLLGLIILFISNKQLLARQENEDIIQGLKKMRAGLYFLIIPFLCVIAHVLFGLPIIIWLAASIIGFILIMIGSHQLREIRISALLETVMVVSLVLFIIFLYSIGNYSLNNLRQEYIEVEIESLEDSVNTHIRHSLTKETFINFQDESSQLALAEFVYKLKTERVENVLVWDMEGRIVYSEHSDLIGFSSFNFDDDYIQAKNGQSAYQLTEEPQANIYSGLSDFVLKFYYPVKIGELEIQRGVVALFVSTSQANQSYWQTKMAIWTLAVGLFIFLLIIFIVYRSILRRVIIEPLQKVSWIAKEIVEKNDYREHTLIQHESDDEIGQIARAFNKITFRLSQNENEKEKNHKNDGWHS
ncbi:HAMP domain-containing protein [Patescibacteria group bacterium]|nr:HAMP domain-containing protein [Patescibacteria group bacterium]